MDIKKQDSNANKKESLTEQVVTLTNRKKLALNGVKEVVSVQEHNAIIKTSLGLMIVSGNGLRVDKLVIEDGHLILNGEISSIKYTGEAVKKNIFARLFK